jgi:hypothetical protein
VLLTPDRGAPLKLGTGPELKELAAGWAYVLRNRARWLGGTPPEELGQNARRDLQRLGFRPRDLETLNTASVVEVGIFFTEGEADREARLFPWEHVLAAAAERRTDLPALLVLRHLDRIPPAGEPTGAGAGSRRLLVVASAPGELGSHAAVGQAAALLRAALEEAQEAAPKITVEVLANPTLVQLEEELSAHPPAAIHLVGFGAQEGAALLGQTLSAPRDGFWLAGADGKPAVVFAETLAPLLAAGRPELVTFQVESSGPELAALTLARGAGAAIGFQDSIDRPATEGLFARFYQRWRKEPGERLPLFRLMFEDLRSLPAETRRGSGLILWSDRSLLAGPPLLQGLDFFATVQKLSTGTGDGGKESARTLVQVDPKPIPDLNYALLHNDQALFREFTLRRKPGEKELEVTVLVELRVGGETFACRKKLVLAPAADPLDLRPQIRLPLAWAYLRSMRESTRVALDVQVSVDGEEVFRNTFPVTLLPADEWRDTPDDNLWLPSFVLPRDPAIERIFDRAERYLKALADRPHAGFDGYQSLDPRAADPYWAIDLQVQALWSALLLDGELVYVNPPPTYRQSSQRLRSPTAVFDGKRGTCVDLALLFAACLEYADLFPVLFLLKGHAFAGYWRSDTSHAERLTVPTGAFVPTTAVQAGTSSVKPSPAPWVITADGYAEVVSFVTAESLVPVETTGLTDASPFSQAVERGMQNLRRRDAFDRLIDVHRARQLGVTPLPL